MCTLRPGTACRCVRSAGKTPTTDVYHPVYLYLTFRGTTRQCLYQTPALQHAYAHVHDLVSFTHSAFNISHTINSLSFGDYFPVSSVILQLLFVHNVLPDSPCLQLRPADLNYILLSSFIWYCRAYTTPWTACSASWTREAACTSTL